ncbi:MAG: hypothetical protein LBE38_12405 [Deltaproteobacteria bacterium]|jgi:hypothetical protein|nr:hypothetical protein [Deltaproteobacteria bacterium]
MAQQPKGYDGLRDMVSDMNKFETFLNSWSETEELEPQEPKPPIHFPPTDVIAEPKDPIDIPVQEPEEPQRGEIKWSRENVGTVPIDPTIQVPLAPQGSEEKVAKRTEGRGKLFWLFLIMNILLIGALIVLILYIFALKDEYSYLAERYKYRNYANLADSDQISWCLKNNLYHNILTAFVTTYDTGSVDVLRSLYPVNCQNMVCTSRDMELALSSYIPNRVAIISTTLYEINQISPFLLFELNDIQGHLTNAAFITDHDLVLEAQRNLRELGYYEGSLDGLLYNPEFQDALKKFQADIHVAENGLLSNELNQIFDAVNLVDFSCVAS